MKAGAGLAIMLWALAAAAYGSVNHPGVDGKGIGANADQVAKPTPNPWTTILQSVLNTVGSEARTVPDLKGQSPASASAVVIKAGLAPRLYPSTQSQDPGARVYWQSPLAHTSATSGSIVAFAVAVPGIVAPPPPPAPVVATAPTSPQAPPSPKPTPHSVVGSTAKTLVQVPDLHGETPLEAQESLKQVGLKLGGVLDGKAPAGGRLDRTDPPVNTPVPRGTAVDYIFIASPPSSPWEATLVVILVGGLGGGTLLALHGREKAREKRFAYNARWRTACSPPAGRFTKAPSIGGPTLHLACSTPPSTAFWTGLATAEDRSDG